MTNSIDFKLGNLEGRMGGVESTVKEIKDGMTAQNEVLDEILAKMNQAKGSWKTLMAVGGALTVVIEGAHHLGEFLTHLK